MKKTDRLLIRLSEADKARLRLAAQADGRSISAFVLRAAIEASSLVALPARGRAARARKGAAA